MIPAHHAVGPGHSGNRQAAREPTRGRVGCRRAGRERLTCDGLARAGRKGKWQPVLSASPRRKGNPKVVRLGLGAGRKSRSCDPEAPRRKGKAGVVRACVEAAWLKEKSTCEGVVCTTRFPFGMLRALTTPAFPFRYLPNPHNFEFPSGVGPPGSQLRLFLSAPRSSASQLVKDLSHEAARGVPYPSSSCPSSSQVSANTRPPCFLR